MGLFKKREAKPVQKAVNNNDLYPGSDFVDPAYINIQPPVPPQQPTGFERVQTKMQKAGEVFDRLSEGMSQVVGGSPQELPPIPQPLNYQQPAPTRAAQPIPVAPTSRVPQAPVPTNQVTDEMIRSAFSEVSEELRKLSENIMNVESRMANIEARIFRAGI